MIRGAVKEDPHPRHLPLRDGKWWSPKGSRLETHLQRDANPGSLAHKVIISEKRQSRRKRQTKISKDGKRLYTPRALLGPVTKAAQALEKGQEEPTTE